MRMHLAAWMAAIVFGLGMVSSLEAGVWASGHGDIDAHFHEGALEIGLHFHDGGVGAFESLRRENRTIKLFQAMEPSRSTSIRYLVGVRFLNRVRWRSSRSWPSVRAIAGFDVAR